MSNYISTEVTDEISFAEIKTKIKSWLFHLKQYWSKLLLVGILGGLLGLLYAFITPKKFKAKLSFVVEEGKSTTGGLASLAGQLGFDVGSSSTGGTSGLLYGENLLLFLKSNNLTKEVLLTPYDTLKNYSLADKYAEVYKLRKKWTKSRKINQTVFFPVTHTLPFTRLQDSLLHLICERILLKEIKVERPEKKASFINVETILRDELLSKYYCERLVTKAVAKYIYYKTMRQKTNVDRLQQRADSIGNILNNKTFISASDQEKILDVNPAARTATVNAEMSSRDKTMMLTLFGEVVKNLEIAKVQLSQETPTIQMVDTVDLPLDDNTKDDMYFPFIGFLIFCFLSTLIIIANKFF